MYKLTGCGLILLTCFWTGRRAALALRREREIVADVIAALERMYGEIAFSGPGFGELCRRVGACRTAAVRDFFRGLAGKAEDPAFDPAGLSPHTYREAGLRLPEGALSALNRLFDSFGRLHRAGQQAQLRLAIGELERVCTELSGNLEARCRTCELLGLSAGAAVLILVV